MPKKIKVRITDKVSSYMLGSKVYHPGDVLEVSEKNLERFMEKLSASKPKATEKLETSTTEEPKPESAAKTEEKKPEPPLPKSEEPKKKGNR